MEIRSYRSLTGAQKAWKKIAEQSGWKPVPKGERSPAEMLKQSAERRIETPGMSIGTPVALIRGDFRGPERRDCPRLVGTQRGTQTEKFCRE
jgi:hypothetical protein